MSADHPTQIESKSTPTEATRIGRRYFLGGMRWALLPVAAIGLSSCTAPKYDPDRGVWVMRPKK